MTAPCADQEPVTYRTSRLATMPPSAAPGCLKVPGGFAVRRGKHGPTRKESTCPQENCSPPRPRTAAWRCSQQLALGDRERTRVQSSHSQISYAVFCLNKKQLERDTRT